MGCSKCRPVVITIGGAPAGVNTVTGTAPVVATPTAGDVNVSIAPGTDGQVLITEGGVAQWGTPLETGTYAPVPVSPTNVTFVDEGEAQWLRVLDFVIVSGWFQASSPNQGEDSVFQLPLPVPTALTGAVPIPVGSVSGIEATFPEMTGGRVSIVPAAGTVGIEWVPPNGGGTVGAIRYSYFYAYRAAP